MNKPDLSITRAQYAGNDHQLYERRIGLPQHLANPITPAEVWMQELTKECTTPEQFIAALFQKASPKILRESLLSQMRADGQRLKAQNGLTSAQVRDQKAIFIMRWIERMEKVIGLPRPWIKAWMKAMGMVDKKGNLTVEFGGDP